MSHLSEGAPADERELILNRLIDAWHALTAGGDPAAQQCGWLKDRFGVSWQVVPAVLPEMMTDLDARKVDRDMAAILAMKRPDIAALKETYDG
jgi:predicted 3-demethylubiquinone-9 3-methyltransferase (glyoxalase superfamily)